MQRHFLMSYYFLLCDLALAFDTEETRTLARCCYNCASKFPATSVLFATWDFRRDVYPVFIFSLSENECKRGILGRGDVGNTTT